MRQKRQFKQPCSLGVLLFVAVSVCHKHPFGYAFAPAIQNARTTTTFGVVRDPGNSLMHPHLSFQRVGDSHQTQLHLLPSPWIRNSPRSYFPASATSALRSITSRNRKEKTRLHISYEDLQEKLPSPQVIDAVESSLKGNKVVASDVAAAAGVTLSQARRDLTALASLSRGDIAVSADGELIYSFPEGLKSVLAQNSAKFKAVEAFRKAWPVVFWLLRVSFGITLLVSLVAIFSTIFFIQSSSSSSSDDDRRRDDRGGGGFGMNFGYFWGPSPLDFFYFRPYGYYGYYGVDGGQRRDPEEMGFLESIFSYIFGDGNPNAKLEEKRLSLVAAMIRQNKGAVTAEQLAPFTDDAPDPSNRDDSSTFVDESFVLPIVTALNGEPRVTEEGNIVYVFPELQTSALESRAAPTTTTSAIVAAKQELTLKRAGLKPSASAREIQALLNYNGISTAGAVEKQDLIRLLDRALPPLTEQEENELLVDTDPTMVQEREWKFSLAPGINKFLAGGLGVVNLGGALYLGNLLNQYALYGVKLPAYFGTVQAFYPFLLAYAVLFNVIPVARNLWIGVENEKIRRRNELRRKWKNAMQSAMESSPALQAKLAAAKRMRTNMKRLTGDDVVYDTSKPFEDLKEKKEKDSLADFDKLLGIDKTSNNDDKNVFM